MRGNQAREPIIESRETDEKYEENGAEYDVISEEAFQRVYTTDPFGRQNIDHRGRSRAEMNDIRTYGGNFVSERSSEIDLPVSDRENVWQGEWEQSEDNSLPKDENRTRKRDAGERKPFSIDSSYDFYGTSKSDIEISVISVQNILAGKQFVLPRYEKSIKSDTNGIPPWMTKWKNTPAKNETNRIACPVLGFFVVDSPKRSQVRSKKKGKRKSSKNHNTKCLSVDKKLGTDFNETVYTSKAEKCVGCEVDETQKPQMTDYRRHPFEAPREIPSDRKRIHRNCCHTDLPGEDLSEFAPDWDPGSCKSQSVHSEECRCLNGANIYHSDLDTRETSHGFCRVCTSLRDRWRLFDDPFSDFIEDLPRDATSLAQSNCCARRCTPSKASLFVETGESVIDFRQRRHPRDRPRSSCGGSSGSVESNFRTREHVKGRVVRSKPREASDFYPGKCNMPCKMHPTRSEQVSTRKRCSVGSLVCGEESTESVGRRLACGWREIATRDTGSNTSVRFGRKRYKSNEAVCVQSFESIGADWKDDDVQTMENTSQTSATRKRRMIDRQCDVCDSGEFQTGTVLSQVHDACKNFIKTVSSIGQVIKEAAKSKIEKSKSVKESREEIERKCMKKKSSTSLTKASCGDTADCFRIDARSFPEYLQSPGGGPLKDLESFEDRVARRRGGSDIEGNSSWENPNFARHVEEIKLTSPESVDDVIEISDPRDRFKGTNQNLSIHKDPIVETSRRNGQQKSCWKEKSSVASPTKSKSSDKVENEIKNEVEYEVERRFKTSPVFEVNAGMIDVTKEREPVEREYSYRRKPEERKSLDETEVKFTKTQERILESGDKIVTSPMGECNPVPGRMVKSPRRESRFLESKNRRKNEDFSTE